MRILMSENCCVLRSCEYMLIKLLEENPQQKLSPENQQISSPFNLNTFKELNKEYLNIISNGETQEQFGEVIEAVRDVFNLDNERASWSVDEANHRLLGVFGNLGDIPVDCSYLKLYLNSYRFTELHLDGVFHHESKPSLPRVLFGCTSVRVLSLCYNNLTELPASIGRLTHLQTLALTNNRLDNSAIPYTLTFCTKLKTLLLDNNLLDGLPGFLLDMTNLEKVHRHGNNNYFKATFMWYHTDVNDRVLPQVGETIDPKWEDYNIPLHSLQLKCIRTIIGTKANFFYMPFAPERLKDYISELYLTFNICGFCNTARLRSQPGFKVFTFKNPYLGNSCVPFVHWACCQDCAECIEIPARVEQMVSASKQDREYNAYIMMLQDQQEQPLRTQSCSIL